MNKKVSAVALLVLFSLAGCSGNAEMYTSESSEPIISSEPHEVSSESSENRSEAISEENSAIEISSDSQQLSDSDIGGEDWCYKHNLMYHTYSPDLVRYVGADNYRAWQETNTDPCSGNIVSFVQYFDISKDVFLQLYAEETSGLTDEFFEDLLKYDGFTKEQYYGTFVLSEEQIDAIYSGDEAQIENAFAGQLAVKNIDGMRYSLHWLETHDAADYIDAGITPESVSDLIETVHTDGEYAKYREEMAALTEEVAQASLILEEGTRG